MKKIVIAAFMAASLSAPMAFAGEKSTLADHDADQNGSLSLAEVQAAKPSVTAEKFAAADTDGNGELSQEEYDAWKAAMKAKKDAAGETKTEY